MKKMVHNSSNKKRERVAERRETDGIIPEHRRRGKRQHSKGPTSQKRYMKRLKNSSGP